MMTAKRRNLRSRSGPAKPRKTPRCWSNGTTDPYLECGVWVSTVGFVGGERTSVYHRCLAYEAAFPKIEMTMAFDRFGPLAG